MLPLYILVNLSEIIYNTRTISYGLILFDRFSTPWVALKRKSKDKVLTCPEMGRDLTRPVDDREKMGGQRERKPGGGKKAVEGEPEATKQRLKKRQIVNRQRPKYAGPVKPVQSARRCGRH